MQKCLSYLWILATTYSININDLPYNKLECTLKSTTTTESNKIQSYNTIFLTGRKNLIVTLSWTEIRYNSNWAACETSNTLKEKYETQL